MDMLIALGAFAAMGLTGVWFFLREQKATKHFVLYGCKLTCIGGSEKGTCPCPNPVSCRLSGPERERFKAQFREDFKKARGTMSHGR